MDFAENQILISTEVLKGKGLKTTPLSQKTPQTFCSYWFPLIFHQKTT